MKEMTNLQTARHLQKWVTQTYLPFAWPTDACGYRQHIKFVQHRNENWHGKTSNEFNQFVLKYADRLLKEENT